jgi:DNA replication protein DnaC
LAVHSGPIGGLALLVSPYPTFGRGEANLFFQVVAKRYGKDSMILTLSPLFPQCATVFVDNTILTVESLERLLHHAHIVSMSGESLRLKDKCKSGEGGRKLPPLR